MEEKNTKERTESKTEKTIKTLKTNRGFDLHQVLFKNTKELVIAFGYKKHKHSELIKHSFSNNKNETIIVDGEKTFEEFVVKVKEKFDYK